MSWVQREIRLEPRPRGFHIITRDILREVPEVEEFEAGIAHVFIRHTSASLTINESASPDVRRDMERHFNEVVPEGAPYWEHTVEGPDDMPAHIKASMMGSSLSVPIRGGELGLGTWQGIFLCEHRNNGGARKLVVTLAGRKRRTDDK